MLLLIGLELEPQALWQMRQRPLGPARMQILGTVALMECFTHGSSAAPIAPGPDELP
ncbi:hypothetical protein [Paracoccus denitrificans]|uniref:hypothetical protein n=1 Tax=Paracoccus denitrificans TaxID=266 RepID=UPI002ED866AA